MSAEYPIAVVWSSSQSRPDGEFETDWSPPPTATNSFSIFVVCLVVFPIWIATPDYAAAVRGLIRLAISLPASISATRSSKAFCRFNHTCGVVPR